MPFDLGNISLRIAAAIAAAGFLVGWIGRSALDAPPQVPTTSVYQDWQVSCPAADDRTRGCDIRQDVLDNRTHNMLLRLLVVRIKDRDTLALTVPYNVLLAPGVGIGLDGKPARIYPFATCNAVGCVARIALDRELAAAIGAAGQARVLFAGLNGRTVGVPFSLKGYKAAMHAYANGQGNRTSWIRRLWS